MLAAFFFQILRQHCRYHLDLQKTLEDRPSRFHRFCTSRMLPLLAEIFTLLVPESLKTCWEKMLFPVRVLIQRFRDTVAVGMGNRSQTAGMIFWCTLGLR